MTITVDGTKLANARRAVKEAEQECALAGQQQADEAAQQRREAAAARKPNASFRMSPETAASKFCYDAGLPIAAEPWLREIFARLERLETSSATPHMRAVEKRG
jgi:hypothetical protein